MTTRAAGFTLIEVVVAMVIVGIAFVVLFGQISQSLTGIPRVERANALVDHARNTLSEIQLIPVIAPGQRVEGRFADGTEWEVETSMFVAPQPTNTGHLLKISVALEQDGSQAAFHTYRFQQIIPDDIQPLREQLDALQLPE